VRQVGGAVRNASVMLAAGALLSLTIGLLALALARNAGSGHAAEDVADAAGAVYEPLFTPTSLQAVLAPVAEQVEAGAFPGAAVAVGVGARESHLLGVGHIGWTRNAPAVDPAETVYDLASLTKVLAAAAGVMLLVDEGRMQLDDPVSLYLPGFDEGAKARVTIRHLLTHTSGLPAGAVLLGGNRRERIARALTFPIFPPAGARVEYSDVGFVLLWEAAERAAGEPFAQYLEHKLYAPLGMHSTSFSPGLDCEVCAPTGRLRDQSLYRGRPFDPLAQRLDGVSGNSGLFSSARDLGRFAAMIVNGGELEGVRVLSEEAVREFVGSQPVGGRYRLGWEVFCDEAQETPAGGCARPRAIGHTGWTGTSLHIEPESGIWVVLLTNRTYEPRAPNRIQQVRRDVFTLATGRAAPAALTAAGHVASGSAAGALPAATATPPPPARIPAER
jgi:serine-type D-Ala-D-Ala carboxypeptidase